MDKKKSFGKTLTFNMNMNISPVINEGTLWDSRLLDNKVAKG